ncbi:MAG TPA: DNA replication and repair protein RecF [bacterium]|nr:DNA replication and repair protein RecF [bacterium]
MKLVHLSLTDFRSYGSLELNLDDGHHLFLGPNGTGKTNILEAIHLLGTGSSQRAQRDGEMVAHGATGFRVGARLHSEDGRSLRVEVALGEGSRKRILLDKDPARASDLLANIKVVSFAPSDVRLVQDSAGNRRRFLDLLGGQISAEYVQLLREHQRAVKQRNETLGRPFVHSRGRPEARRAREPWSDLVVELGARLFLRRADLVEHLAAAVSKLTGGAFRDAGALEARYVPGVEWSGDDPRDALRAAMDATVDKDEALGYTTAGPQKDDLLLKLGGRVLRHYGSLGQQQLSAMFLKLSQADLVRTAAGATPLLLVDEMFAVLDRRAAEEFLARVEGEGQIFLATAQEGWLGELRDRRFHVHPVGGSNPGEDSGNAV